MHLDFLGLYVAMLKPRKEILLLLLSILLAFVLAESILRHFGYKPGIIGNKHSFEIVDSLIPYDGYIADSNGMTYADPIVASKLSEYLHTVAMEEYPKTVVESIPGWRRMSYDLSCLAGEYPSVIHSTDTSAFTKFYQRIKAKREKDDFDSLVSEYVLSPINSDGFRSIAFRKSSRRKRILLIGDSFTFGYSAKIKTHSFYDLLLSRGYEVYSTGIIGADPAQYQAVAEKYIPLLKPDMVVVNFYLGNDVQYYRQSYDAYQSYFYRTNAGALVSCPLGVRMHDANEAYRVTLDMVSIPADGGLANRICRKTALGTCIWNLLKNVFHFEVQSNFIKDFYRKAEALKLDHPDANDRIPVIQKLCAENNSKFVLAIIPALATNAECKLAHVKEDSLLFKSIPYIECPQLTMKDYCTGGDTHFNDQGHSKYADFLQSIIDTTSNR